MTQNASNPAGRFLEAFNENDALREKLLSVQNQPKELMALLQSEGYHFTRAEWESALSLYNEADEAENAALPDESLEGVAGGDLSRKVYSPKIHRHLTKAVSDFFKDLF